MRKLEDIPKKSVFKVPEGYFDQLPTAIQTRMAREGHRAPASRAIGFSLKYALPVVALLVAGIFWFRPGPPLEEQFDDIDTEQIYLYLDNSEHIDLDENHETMDWSKSELEELEQTIYSNMEYSTDDILEDIDLDNL